MEKHEENYQGEENNQQSEWRPTKAKSTHNLKTPRRRYTIEDGEKYKVVPFIIKILPNLSVL